MAEAGANCSKSGDMIREKSWGKEECLDIPLELVSISARKRFSGKRLIIALLSLLFSVTLFVFLLMRFFVRQSTFILNVCEGKLVIEFWAPKQENEHLTRLIKEIIERATGIQDRIPYPISSATGYTFQQPWKQTIALIWLCAIPGFILEKPLLLLLCILPVMWHTEEVLCQNRDKLTPEILESMHEDLVLRKQMWERKMVGNEKTTDI